MAVPSTISTAVRTPVYQTVSLIRAGVKSRSSIPSAECIPEPSYGADRIGLDAGSLQLAANVVHVDVDHIRSRREALAPDLLAQLVAGEHLTGVPHQVLEQRELRAGQLDRLAVHPCLARAGIQHQRAGLQQLGVGPAPAAQGAQ